MTRNLECRFLNAKELKPYIHTLNARLKEGEGEGGLMLSVRERLWSRWPCSDSSCKSACCAIWTIVLQAGIAQQGETADDSY